MTHSLHRQGTVENLSHDYPLVTVAAHGISDAGAGPKIAEILRTCMKHGAINMGDMKTGSIFTYRPEEIYEKVTDTTIAEALFNDIEKVQATLEELKEKDLGISVVVSGLFDEMRQCCWKAGLEFHTVAQSLGVWGKTERLPSQEILQLTTMCGHALVSTSLVQKLVEDIKQGKNTAERAAQRLAKPCVCGLFNTERAARLLSEAARA